MKSYYKIYWKDSILPNNIIDSHTWEKIKAYPIYDDYKCINCSYILYSGGRGSLEYTYYNHKYTSPEKLLTCAEIQLENIIK